MKDAKVPVPPQIPVLPLAPEHEAALRLGVLRLAYLRGFPSGLVYLVKNEVIARHGEEEEVVGNDGKKWKRFVHYIRCEILYAIEGSEQFTPIFKMADLPFDKIEGNEICIRR